MFGDRRGKFFKFNSFKEMQYYLRLGLFSNELLTFTPPA